MFKLKLKTVEFLSDLALLCKVYYIKMSQILPYTCEQLGGVQINCILDDGEPWFTSIYVATALKHTDTDQAIRKHVADDDKHQQGSFNLHPVKKGVKR